MKRVCFFIGNMNNVGGTERVTSVIANELQELGYHIHILSLQCGELPFFNLSPSIHVDQLFNMPGRGIFRLPLAIIKLRHYLKKNKFDVLINVESMLVIYSMPAVLGMNIRNICWEHFNYNIDLGKSIRRVARKLAALFTDDIITLTERDKMLWLSKAKCSANITAIPNPVTIKYPNSINFKKKKIFLAVGRLTYQKGFDLLLQAWSSVAVDNPDWHLRIVGDGEDKTDLERMCRELNIINSVQFIPKTNNIAEHYMQASFFIMSSRFEGLPLVLIEAQAYGLPIVSFDCDTGPSEVVINNKTGWLCTPLDHKELSQLISKAIALRYNSEKYECFCVESMKNANSFAVSKIIDKWMVLLNGQK
ncbi:glycosyltransferase family 4 protein [Aeromonas caviae]